MNNGEEYRHVRARIGWNIGQLREKCGVSQAALARSISVDRSYVNQMERGRKNVSVDILVKIADGLDVPLTELFEGLEELPPYRFPSEAKYRFVGLDGGAAADERFGKR